MHSITKNMLFYLEETRNAQSQQAQLAEVRRLNEYWDTHCLYLESVVVHNDLEEAGASLSRIESAAMSEDHDDFQAAVRLLREQLEHIARTEELRLGNIL